MTGPDVGIGPPTASQRRAARWWKQSQAEAKRVGAEIDAETEAYFTHLIGCPVCELREHSDPELCDVAEARLDGEEGLEG